MAKEQFHQGAVVRKRYYCEPARRIDEVGLGPRPSVVDKAYELAMANRHKTWAKRWLKERRYS
jgi:hypothetical protein